MSSEGRPASSRPRIRKAHSAEQEYSGPAAANGAPAQPPHGGGGDTHWYGEDGILYFRGDDGAVFYLASDGAYYPRELLADALASSASGPQAVPTAAPAASAADDRSTYYEYIARHSDEFPAHPGRPGRHPGTPSASTQSAGTPYPGAPQTGAAGTFAEAPVGHPPAPPRPSGPPHAYGTGGSPAGVSAASANGHTPPRRRRVRAVVGTFAVLAVVALGVTLGFVYLGPDRGVQSTDIESTDPAVEPTDPAATDPYAPSGDAEAPAGDQLNEHVAEGTRVAHEQLEGQWVVQLSAKKQGLEANGRTWDEQAILEEFEENQRRHPEAVLLWSGDWSSFRLGDFWVTILAEPYDDAAGALATCRNLGLDRDNCFAKKLSTTEGPDGTTELND